MSNSPPSECPKVCDCRHDLYECVVSVKWNQLVPCLFQGPSNIVTVSENEETFDEESEFQYSLRIMIVNPNKKSEYVMVKAHKTATEMITFGEVKQPILDSFPANVPLLESEQLQLGFIEPGHGLKGKKEWILDDEHFKNVLVVVRKLNNLGYGAIAKIKEDPNERGQSLLQLQYPNNQGQNRPLLDQVNKVLYGILRR